MGGTCSQQKCIKQTAEIHGGCKSLRESSASNDDGRVRQAKPSCACACSHGQGDGRLAHESPRCMVPRYPVTLHQCTDRRPRAACEMTPGEEPLVCSCGDHSARLQPVGIKKRNWQIFSVLKSGHKPQIVTSRAKKTVAVEIVRELCGGTYKKRNKPQTASVAPAENSRPSRKRKVQSLDATASTAPKPAATKPGGPGRGNKGPKWDDAVHQAERLLRNKQASNEELRYVLKRTVDQCKSLQQMCDEVSPV